MADESPGVGASLPTPPRPEQPAREGTVPTSASSASGRGHTARKWLRKLRRTSVATPSDPDFTPEISDRRAISLLERGPFTIGFFATFGALTAYGLLQAVVGLRSVIVLVVLSFYIALGLNPAVEWIHRRGLRRGIAVAIIALTAIATLTLALWTVVPLFVDQITQLTRNAPAYLEALRTNPQIAALDEQFDILGMLSRLLSTQNWFDVISGGLAGAGNVVFSIVVTLVVTLYFLASLPTIKDVVYELAPASRRPRVRYLANEMFERIGGYLGGLFTVVTIAAIVSFVFFNIVGLVNLSLALATVVAMFWFIPLVGSFVAILIVAVVAFSLSPTTGLITLVFMLAYQQFDVYVIQPRVFARSVSVPGLIVVLAAISGGVLMGMPGAILAVPTAAVLLLLYREVLLPHLNRL